MNTPKLNKASVDLSIRLGDPVTEYNSDGRIFSKDVRLSLLNSAFQKVIRTLESLGDDVEKIINNYYQMITIPDDGYVQDSNGIWHYKLIHGYNILDVYYINSTDNSGKRIRADYTPADKFYSEWYGINAFTMAQVNKKKWTVVDNKLILFPFTVSAPDYKYVQVLTKNYFTNLSHDLLNDDKGVELNLPNYCMDMLISYATIEGMTLIKDQSRYELFLKQLTMQLELLRGTYVNK